MKSVLSRLGVLFLLLVLLGVSHVAAQISPNGVDFKVTTAFVAQNAKFPAGSYTIKPAADDIELLELTGSDGHSAFVACEGIETASPEAKTELTFYRYGSALYLKQIWIQGSNTGCLIQTGPAERKS